MGFWKEIHRAWKTSQEEKRWKKQFDKKPVSSEMQTEKAEFTAKGEPWVNIIRMDVDPDELSSGAIELDWNDIFVARLVKAGYQGKDDKAIVDQWFHVICENVIADTYEQEIADPDKRRRIQRKRLEDGRAEIS